MNSRILKVALASFFLCSCSVGGPKLTPAEEFRIQSQGYERELSKYIHTLRHSYSNETKLRKTVERDPTPRYAKKMLALMLENPHDLAVEDAALWLLENAKRSSDSAEARTEAVRFLTSNFAKSSRMLEVILGLREQADADSLALLRRVKTVNPSPNIRGAACLILGKNLAGPGGKPLFDLSSLQANPGEAEARACFIEVRDKYGEVVVGESNLGQIAASELFELENLQPGKKVPELEGEDVDGKKLRLSDYKGKVILLSYFGHW